MNRIKQSLSWWCFAGSGVAPATLLRAAREIGYEAVELMEPEHWHLARDAGLTIASHGAHASISDGLNRRENHTRIVEEVRVTLDQAVRWGIPTLICFSGNRAGLDDEAGAEITAEGLRRLAPMAEDAGVTLVVELLNSKVDHPDYQCDRTAWGRQVCQMVGSPRVKLLYDIYHMQIMEGDIIRTIRDAHAHIGHYHTAGNPGRHDLDEAQELSYPAIMRAILETGYDGYVGHEFLPRGEAIAALKAAYDLCDVALPRA
ncbi:MAG: TIM barrel protein [Chloroflexota bacterium]